MNPQLLQSLLCLIIGAPALLLGLLCVLRISRRDPATRKVLHMTPEQVERTLWLEQLRRKDVA